MIRLVALLLSVFLSVSAQAEETHFYVEGAGGVPLAVTVTGPKDGPEILLLHGLGHGRDSFLFQLESDLAKDFRMAAFDLRGHGQSGKPWTEADYASPTVWAEDVLAVMDAAEMKKPVVVGWSYGGLVAANLLRHSGSERVAGLVLVSSLAGMVKYTPDYSEGGEDMARAYRFFGAPSVTNQAAGNAIVAPYLYERKPAAPWPSRVKQLNMMLPPYVRPLLFKHRSDNTDLIGDLPFPVLIIHGEDDAAIPQSAVDQFIAQSGVATAVRFEGIGHSPFAEDPGKFNALLRAFLKNDGKKPS